jgi:anti-sigma regulatory factor (Ser/Thr protein kinase)
VRDAPASDAAAGGLWGPFEVTLRGELDAPAMARATVAGWMAGQVDEPTLADAQLLVGELVGNSVRHADTPDGAPVSVRAKIRGDALHLEVQDGGTRGSITRRAPDLQDGGGFGLNLVEAISRRWGVARGAGTRVWAEIALATGARAAVVVPDAAGPAHAPGAERSAAAVAALMRANGARRRASAARHARDRATTEYARWSQSRVADLHAAIARHHEELARRLRLRGADSDPGVA